MSVTAGGDPDAAPHRETGKPLLRMRSIPKSFGGVVALSDVDLECSRGECHALVGENGAGKSTRFLR